MEKFAVLNSNLFYRLENSQLIVNCCLTRCSRRIIDVF